MEALIVERDDALELARELAERRGTSVDEAVVASLRAALRETPPTERPSPRPRHVPSLEELNPDQRARYESLQAFIRQIAVHKVPRATSDHRDMYDENGLPI